MADVISVSALNKYVRSVLESDSVLADIAITGEISNFNRNYKTGHCYFSLKDDNSSVKAVMFRSHADRLAFTPENGMRVIARGRVTLYERDGAFQLYVEFLFPDGIGAAQIAFEQLKQRLHAEGLFDTNIKKPLPAFPGAIGLVTSKTGAALQDILRVAQRRCPMAHFVLAPVSVQGQQAVPEICSAIKQLDESGLVDMIIVARGGGSAEDLWVFNDEAVARAAFLCHIPLISAVGHEIDFTILDFVADRRAATPTEAAELALPDMDAVMEQMMHIFMNISNNIQFRVELCYNQIKRCYRHPVMQMQKNRVRQNRIQLAQYKQTIKNNIDNMILSCQERVRSTAALAAGLNPYHVLARGYCVARAGQQVVRCVQDVTIGQKLDLVLQQGGLTCEVLEIYEKLQVE